MTMTDQIIEAMPAAEYHAVEAWGSTALKALRKGPPARVLWEREHPQTTEAMQFGTAVHARILTPRLYIEAYCHKPEGMSFATKDGKAWRDEHRGQLILTHDQSTLIKGIEEALYAKALVFDALKSDRREISLFWADEHTMEPCKGRIDLLDDTHLYDLKVSRYAAADLSYRAFCEGWLHQLAHYRTGAERLGLGTLGARLIVVSPVAPHFVYCVEVKPDALDLLALENSQTVYALEQCDDANDWPGTPDEWTKIEIPPNALISTTVLDSLPEEE